MSAFSKPTFNTAAYAAARPVYNPRLYKYVITTSSLPPTTVKSPDSPTVLLDLGCGPGLSTFPFLSYNINSYTFAKVIGIDPSAGMIETAKAVQEAGIADKSIALGKSKVGVDFRVGRAGELHDIEDASVDLVVAGQAAHWFDMPLVYKEMRRVLKPGGTFALWGYGEAFYPQSRVLSQLISEYSGGLLAPYWQQPGRSIVEDLLNPIPFPNNDPSALETPEEIAQYGAWDPTTFHRTRFARWGEPQLNPLPIPLPGESEEKIVMRHKWTIQQMESYLRTWSAALAYEEATGQDPVGPLMEKIKPIMKSRKHKRKDNSMWLSWKLGLIMGKKALV